MMFPTFVGVVVLSQAPGIAGDHGHGHVSNAKWMPALPTSLSETLVADGSMPSNFDWRDVDGKSYVTADWNQHIPQYCGACWIHGTISALNDRIKVRRGARFPDVRLARQSILNCVPAADGDGPPPGCNGGEAWMIHKYLNEQKMPDETCMPYRAANMGCSPDTVCRNCGTGDKGCWAVKNYIGYGISSYGKVKGEKAMMKEIYARGPIVCSFATEDHFMNHFAENIVKPGHEGVYTDGRKFNVSQIDHDMEVAGWGETASGQKYWHVRNSWGTYWGEAGWFKLSRGTNAPDGDIMSESDCDWAELTFDELDEDLAGKVLGDYVRGITPEAQVKAAQWTPPADLAASALAGSRDAEAGSAAVLTASFLAGVPVALLAGFVARRTRVREQPFLLG